MPRMVVDKTPVSVLKIGNEDFISLTDMASGKDGQNRSADIIKNWIRTRYTLEFLGTWEILKWSNLTTLKSRRAYRALH